MKKCLMVVIAIVLFSASEAWLLTQAFRAGIAFGAEAGYDRGADDMLRVFKVLASQETVGQPGPVSRNQL